VAAAVVEAVSRAAAKAPEAREAAPSRSAMTRRYRRSRS